MIAASATTAGSASFFIFHMSPILASATSAVIQSLIDRSADFFAHDEAAEGPVASKLIGIVHAIGQFVIDECLAGPRLAHSAMGSRPGHVRCK